MFSLAASDSRVSKCSGPIDAFYRIEYRDYREALTSGRVKK
jgi:hypothetical protein